MRNISGTTRRSISKSLAYSALAVAFITACAWISVPVGPIPVTLQTFAVCLIGALLGPRRGLAAIGTYLLMGLVGIPVFAGFGAGPATLFGPTGGYLFGFVFAVAFPAFIKFIPVKNAWGRTFLFYASMLLGLAVCYLFGTLWFVNLYHCTVAYALGMCVVPYLLPDAVKLSLAALLAVRLESVVR